jgi:hypothetical protein
VLEGWWKVRLGCGKFPFTRTCVCVGGLTSKQHLPYAPCPQSSFSQQESCPRGFWSATVAPVAVIPPPQSGGRHSFLRSPPEEALRRLLLPLSARTTFDSSCTEIAVACMCARPLTPKLTAHAASSSPKGKGKAIQKLAQPWRCV